MVSEMKYIKDYKDGDRVFDIYFCKYKSSAVTKNGKNYDNVIVKKKILEPRLETDDKNEVQPVPAQL